MIIFIFPVIQPDTGMVYLLKDIFPVNFAA
jgi:hypothetical protein